MYKKFYSHGLNISLLLLLFCYVLTEHVSHEFIWFLRFFLLTEIIFGFLYCRELFKEKL